MKIGIDARMYGSGFTGIGRYTYELIRHLATLDPSNEYVVFLRRDAFDGFAPPAANFRKVLTDFPHYSFSEQIGFLKILNQERLDLMHFTHFNAPIFYHGPSVVTIHDLTLSFFPGKKMNGWIRRLAYHATLKSITRKARRIIAVSENTKADLVRLMGVPPDKVSVIYNGVSPSFSESSPVTKTILLNRFSLHKPYFLYTGVWRDHKNVVGLLQAFAQLKKEKGPLHQLAITGRPNPSYPEIPATIQSLGLESEVVLTGLVNEEELRGLYQNALAYIFPSFYEGFGFPPLEAMQSGIPVAVSNISSIPEVCGEGNALYFDPRDSSAICAAMRRLATEPDLRQTLVDRGRLHVRRFDWSRMAKGVLGVYVDALKTKP
jgi:glycosyltransferase involved in cell wall biosynthesis